MQQLDSVRLCHSEGGRGGGTACVSRENRYDSRHLFLFVKFQMKTPNARATIAPRVFNAYSMVDRPSAMKGGVGHAVLSLEHFQFHARIREHFQLSVAVGSGDAGSEVHGGLVGRL